MPISDLETSTAFRSESSRSPAWLARITFGAADTLAAVILLLLLTPERSGSTTVQQVEKLDCFVNRPLCGHQALQQGAPASGFQAGPEQCERRLQEFTS